MLPPVKCDNVGRALYLLRLSGTDIAGARRGSEAWFETHPRLIPADLAEPDLLVRVSTYKGRPRRVAPEERARAAHQARVALFARLLTKLPMLEVAPDQQALAVSSDGHFEAVLCAVAGVAKALGATRRYPEDDLPDQPAALEGYVFTVEWTRLAASVSKYICPPRAKTSLENC